MYATIASLHSLWDETQVICLHSGWNVPQHVLSAVQACIWELWLFSSSLFASLAVCSCADVLLPDVAALRKAGRQAVKHCRLNSVQFRALQVFSLMDLSLQRWISWRTQKRCRNLDDDLWWPRLLLLSLAFLVLCVSSDKCAKQTKRKSIRHICWQKPFNFFDCASSFVLSLGVGSRDTMGGMAIKGLLLEWSLLHS